MDLAEAGTVVFVAVPALHHEVEDFLRAVLWLGQVDFLSVLTVEMPAVLHHLLIGQALEWRLAGKVEHLPEGDGKRPNVTTS